ncbi:integrase core domain protein [Lasius niger]|uniref:Integrase core domain protein n=1 Tax=Lasius niger TaxID=67767 RepID=A0A0J7JWP1_LASNI|nr:integrase core domain protein [Lasius niger]
MTGQLPIERISEAPAFTAVGLDFAGPLFVKSANVQTKAYILLFTCATTRAVHLELCSSMSTNAFLMAFRRFLARRGNSEIIISDNAKSFKAADLEIHQFLDILKTNEFKDFVTTKGIDWKFIVEYAPWWGGFYERMVKAVKEPLRKILGKASLTFEELLTVLCEIEYVINMRPLTYVSNELEEPEPLTPNHFLQITRTDVHYPLHFVELTNRISNKESLSRRKRYQTTLLKQLWQKWKHQYLLQLKGAHHSKTVDVSENLKPGNVVLIEGPSKNKLLWDLAKVVETYTGRDGLVRACLLKTGKGLTIRRPVQLIYPFETEI